MALNESIPPVLLGMVEMNSPTERLTSIGLRNGSWQLKDPSEKPNGLNRWTLQDQFFQAT